MRKKRCSKCKKLLPLDAEHFYRNHSRTSGLDHACKKCNNARRKERAHYSGYLKEYSRNVYRPKLKAFINDIKKEGCCICGYDRCLTAIEFHHLGDKDRLVSACNGVNSIKKEMSKCVLVCAVCHREIHAGLIPLGEYENKKLKIIQPPTGVVP